MISKPGLYLLFSSDRCTVVPTLFDAHCLKTSSSASFSFASPVNHQHFNKERVVVLCSNHLCTYSENGKKKICTTVPILFPEESIGFHFSRLSQRQKNQQVITSFLSVKRVAQCKKASLSVNTGFLLHPSVFFFYTSARSNQESKAFCECHVYDCFSKVSLHLGQVTRAQ